MNTTTRVLRKDAPKPRRTFQPERKASDCYDWITADDIVRHALAAFYTAARRCNQQPDDPTGENLEFNNGRAAFAEEVAYIFGLRLDEQGFKVGAPGFHDYATEMISRLHPNWKPKEKKTPAILQNQDRNPDIHRTLSLRSKNRAGKGS